MSEHTPRNHDLPSPTSLTLPVVGAAALLGALLLLLTGCGGGGGSDATATPAPTPTPTPSPETVQLTVDASAGGFPPNAAIGFTYVNLVTGTTVALSDSEAAQSKDWHIAFRRTDIRLNGGVSGLLGVKGAIAVTPDGFYDAQGTPITSTFKDPNINAASMLAPFTGLSDAQVQTLSYKSDAYLPFIIGDGSALSWFAYDMQTHTLSANSDNWWLIRGAEGDSYARLHVIGLEQNAKQVSIEMYLQPKGSAAFEGGAETWVADLGVSGTTRACYDFETRAPIACETGSNWDLMVEIDGRSWNLWTNSGNVKGSGKGGAFGVLDASTAGSYGSAAGVPNFFADSRGGVFADATSTYNWALYSEQKMWPNYRVYAIDTAGNGRYALQILSYYHPGNGASGHYSIRFRKLP
ncbi:MAG: HmuY family protein [Halothiobacillaceae bacterium]|jgi:hypothetical protein|nr:HmuY family protein [Halothiobacillaceae bacterium]